MTTDLFQRAATSQKEVESDFFGDLVNYGLESQDFKHNSPSHSVSSDEISDITPSKPHLQVKCTSSVTPFCQQESSKISTPPVSKFPANIFEGAFDVPNSTPIRTNNRYSSPMLKRITSPLPHMKEVHLKHHAPLTHQVNESKKKPSCDENSLLLVPEIMSCRVEELDDIPLCGKSSQRDDKPQCDVSHHPKSLQTTSSSGHIFDSVLMKSEPPSHPKVSFPSIVSSSIVELPHISKRDTHWSTSTSVGGDKGIVPPSPGTAARLAGYRNASRGGFGTSLKSRITAAPISLAASPHSSMMQKSHTSRDFAPSRSTTFGSLGRRPTEWDVGDQFELHRNIGGEVHGSQQHPFAPKIQRHQDQHLPTRSDSSYQSSEHHRTQQQPFYAKNHQDRYYSEPSYQSRDDRSDDRRERSDREYDRRDDRRDDHRGDDRDYVSSCDDRNMERGPNFSAMSADERLFHKMRLMDQIRVLQITNPEYNDKIPIPSDDCSVEMVFAIYKTYNRKVMAAKDSVQYRLLLIVSFIFIELIFGYFGIDFTGFAEKQIRLIGRYKSTLEELAEKFSGGGGGFQMSVEMRLFLLVGFQSVMFVVFKYLSRFLGNGTPDALENVVYGLADFGMANMNSEEKLDAYGIPIVPGTESQIESVYNKSSNFQANAFSASGGGGSTTSSLNIPQTASSTQQPMDISGMIAKCLTGGMGGGGGGLDIASLVGGALNFINPITARSSTRPSPPTNPEPVSTTSPKSTSKQSPTLSSPPRSGRVRKVQYSE